MTTSIADPLLMQRRLFAELSRMFGEEVPLYDKSLAVNLRCNRAVADLLADCFDGFSISDVELDATSRERHGAIRIGREDEFRWITRYFACFGMLPHNFYDMTSIGEKSQPVIATAFRSTHEPENRVFASLLRTDYFDDSTAERINSLLSSREVFSPEARELVERCERQGGLSHEDGAALVDEGVTRIFKWTGEARGQSLYQDLCSEGFKIAADIACFSSHHLNHLTPNTLCIDLYSEAMRWRLGIIDRSVFLERAHASLCLLARMVDRQWLMLHFRHLSHGDVDSFAFRVLCEERLEGILQDLVEALDVETLALSLIHHNGYKDSTEGPDAGTQILLRQDAYRALTEPIRFVDETPVVDSTHTARFGEIEQRFYATTPVGRSLYDQCLTAQTSAHQSSGEGAEIRSDAFGVFPSTLNGLVKSGLVYAFFEPVRTNRKREEAITTADVDELVEQGLLRYRGIRYEDFLPISAAGIFASNLDQYGTDSTADQRPSYSRHQLEAIIGRPIVDSDATYQAIQATSLLTALEALGVDHLLDAVQRSALEQQRSFLEVAAASPLA